MSFQVRKSGDFLLVESDESSDTQIDVRFPLPVVDALLSNPDGPLDFSAAIHTLAEYDNGNMVTVRDRDTTVRVWVDSSNTDPKAPDDSGVTSSSTRRPSRSTAAPTLRPEGVSCTSRVS